jgi:phage baseplate assembly protein W
MSYNKETPMMEENGIDANIFGFLFAPLDISNALMIREYVKSALELNEPRIDNIYVNVSISEPQSGYIINIYYNIVNSNNNTQQTTVFLKNVR